MGLLPISLPGSGPASGGQPTDSTDEADTSNQSGTTDETQDTTAGSEAVETPPDEPVTAPDAAEGADDTSTARRDAPVFLSPVRAEPQSVVQANAQAVLSADAELAAARAQAEAYVAQARIDSIVERVGAPVEVAPLQAGDDPATGKVADNPLDRGATGQPAA